MLIPRRKIRTVFELLAREGFAEDIYRERFRAWVQFSRSRSALLVLLAGARGVGTSAVAVALAERLGPRTIVDTDVALDVWRTATAMRDGEGDSFQPDGEDWVPLDLDNAADLRAFRASCSDARTALAGDVAKCMAEGTMLVVEGEAIDGEHWDELCGRSAPEPLVSLSHAATESDSDGEGSESSLPPAPAPRPVVLHFVLDVGEDAADGVVESWLAARPELRDVAAPEELRRRFDTIQARLRAPCARHTPIAIVVDPGDPQSAVDEIHHQVLLHVVKSEHAAPEI